MLERIASFAAVWATELHTRLTHWKLKRRQESETLIILQMMLLMDQSDGRSLEIKGSKQTLESPSKMT